MSKISIRISCSQRFSFDQVVEMTPEEWKKLKATSESKIEDGDSSPIASLIDATDPVGWGDFDDLEMFVVDNQGEPVKPNDSYGE